MVDCAFDVDNDKQVADQEDHGNDTTEQIRADHCCRHSASGVLRYMISKIATVLQNSHQWNLP